jgi:hypothetical protein
VIAPEIEYPAANASKLRPETFWPAIVTDAELGLKVKPAIEGTTVYVPFGTGERTNEPLLAVVAARVDKPEVAVTRTFPRGAPPITIAPEMEYVLADPTVIEVMAVLFAMFGSYRRDATPVTNASGPLCDAVSWMPNTVVFDASPRAQVTVEPHESTEHRESLPVAVNDTPEGRTVVAVSSCSVPSLHVPLAREIVLVSVKGAPTVGLTGETEVLTWRSSDGETASEADPAERATAMMRPRNSDGRPRCKLNSRRRGARIHPW